MSNESAVFKSFLYIAKNGALAAAEEAGLDDLDCEDLLSASPEPYPSLRAHYIDDIIDGHRTGMLVQLSLRVYTLTINEAILMDFRSEFLKELRVVASTQRPGKAIHPRYNFKDPAYLAAYEQDSNSVPPVQGKITIEQASSKTWQNRPDGRETWLNILRLNLFQ